MASITTRVTPRLASRSAILCKERVIVEYVCTSCSPPTTAAAGHAHTAHQLGLADIQAATRAMISSSCVFSSITGTSGDHLTIGFCSVVTRGSGKGHAKSNPRARSNTEGPTSALPASD